MPTDFGLDGAALGLRLLYSSQPSGTPSPSVSAPWPLEGLFSLPASANAWARYSAMFAVAVRFAAVSASGDVAFSVSLVEFSIASMSVFAYTTFGFVEKLRNVVQMSFGSYFPSS